MTVLRCSGDCAVCRLLLEGSQESISGKRKSIWLLANCHLLSYDWHLNQTILHGAGLLLSACWELIKKPSKLLQVILWKTTEQASRWSRWKYPISLPSNQIKNLSCRLGSLWTKGPKGKFQNDWVPLNSNNNTTHLNGPLVMLAKVGHLWRFCLWGV